MPSPHLQHLRPLEPGDMTWLLPMADQYGERDGLLAAWPKLLAGWVVPGKAMLCFLGEAEGVRVAGLTDRAGIRALLALGRHVRQWAQEHDLYPIYARVSGDWQRRAFRAMGFDGDGDVLWARSAYDGMPGQGTE